MTTSSRAISLLGRLRRGGVASPRAHLRIECANNTGRCVPTAFFNLQHCSCNFSYVRVMAAGDARRLKSGDASNDSKSAQFVQWDGLANGKRPTINHVRSLPIIGSLPTPRLTGVPPINILTNAYDFWIAFRNKFGEFYSYGSLISGNPNDLYRTSHVINDPNEYKQIIRAGGFFPSGLLESLWVNIRWGESRGMHAFVGMHSRGEEWRRLRMFLQTELLHPDAARGYVPGIAEAATRASKGARAAAILQSSGEEKEAINAYLHRCAFDMFSSVMLGICTETADRTTPIDPEDERFIRGVVIGLGEGVKILFSPYELIFGKLLKFETAQMNHCFQGFDEAWTVLQDKAERFIERMDKSELTENERASYLCRALGRRMEEGCDVTVREVLELVFLSLGAAVDTTSSVLSWNLFHIARLPHVQEKLYEEISASVENIGNGQITDEVLKKTNTPYLHGVLRETRRVTPTSAIGIQKTINTDDCQIHGRRMKKGDVVILETFTPGMNPDMIEDTDEFRPERWLQDEIECRKGTPSEVIDHPFLAEPFSQGARKCPGSRVATNEIKVLLSQLVLDWKISSPVTDLRDVKYQQKTMIEVQLPDLQFEARV